ncbi:MAG: copper amine oxidase N-terminal domain-containing protein [Thermanaeromonas sp.]|uniref:copper amine oxidase N-terminal domain-containing protein n=1 Tax=Thermanaeromonas sp. TaxID=2003697 RepID=UPI00243F03B9|nr:copper amine oxidase N-terminal domain-containing protein [Thermanaeromonas sp.]MCG0277949.1 copper amine oxidase N-terminal domain-containing protein [Thermanaeromonas sp.]
MMKKITLSIMTIALALTLAAAAFAQDAIHPKIFVDGKEIHPDVPAYINSDNRTMIPYRAVSEALGATVDWNEADQSVTAKYKDKYGERTVVMWIGKNQYTVIQRKDYRVNNIQKVMDTVPVIVNGRTMIPLRAVAEGLGCVVRWNAVDYAVYVISPNAKAPGTPAGEYPGFQNAPNYVYDDYTKRWPVQEPANLPYTTPLYGITIYSYQIGDKQVHVRMSEYSNYSLIIKKKDGSWTQSTPDKKDYYGAYTTNPDGTVTVHYPIYHAGEWLAHPEEIAEMYICTPGMYVKLPY